MASATAGAEVNAAAGTAALGSLSGVSWPPTDRDLSTVARTTGAAAAAAACSAYGLSLAAPLCAEIGARVAGWVNDRIVQPFANLFGNRNREAWERYRADMARAAAWGATEQQMIAWEQAQRALLDASTTALEQLHTDLYGSPSGLDWLGWRAILGQFGAPLRVVGREPDGRELLAGPSAVLRWRELLGGMPSSPLAFTQAAIVVDGEQRQFAASLERATYAAGAQIVAGAAAWHALVEAESRRETQLSPGFSRFASVLAEPTPPTRAEPSAAPWIVGGLLVAGGAAGFGWWWYTRRRRR